MNVKTQLMLWLAVLGLLDAVVPFFPIVALVLLYILLERPPWFLDRVREIYGVE